MSDLAVAVPAPARRHRPWLLLLAGTWRQGRTKIGLAIVLVLVGTALVGPFFAPYAPDEPVVVDEVFAFPFDPPSDAAKLGTDDIGRDVLSRFLWGGRSVLALSALATALGVAIGLAVGLFAAYSRGLLDDVLITPAALRRGKLALLPKDIEGREEVRRIFEACERAARKEARS